MVAEGLGNLYEDGISIKEALLLVSEMPIGKEYAFSLKEIANEVLKGETLSDAFNKREDLYPGLFTGLIRIGENSGKLGESFLRLHDFYYKFYKLRNEIVGALIYPAFLILVLLTLGCTFVFFLLPMFYESYLSVGAIPPTLAKIFYDISILAKESTLLFFTKVVSYGAMALLLFYLFGRYLIKWNGIKNRIRIYREHDEYVFILVLTLLMESAVPLPVGIGYCLDFKDLKGYKDSFKKVNEVILAGYPLSAALENIGFISQYSLSMVKLGEGSGALSNRLRRALDRLQGRMQNSIKRLTSLIQPVIIIAMAVLVAIAIVVFVLPMFDMMYGGVV